MRANTCKYKKLYGILKKIGCAAPLCLSLIFAFLMLSLTSCTGLVSYTASKQTPYKFLGVKKVTANGDGTFVIDWDKIPKGTASYELFLKTGTSADPQAASVGYDFTHPFIKLSDTTYTTENVLLKYNVCFIVRLIYPKYIDTNINEVCTNHTKFNFTGIDAASSGSEGVVLSWSLIPTNDVLYMIFDTSTAGIYNFTIPLVVVATAKQNTYKAAPVPLGQTRCYLVRYYKENNPADNNSKEICVGESSLGNFAGIETVTSLTTGSASITWQSAGSTIKNYRIYQGLDFSKLIDTASGDSTSDIISTFTPGKTYDLGVRAVDANGREDSNTKTIALKIVDLNAPVFAGISQIESAGTRSLKVKWVGSSPLPTKYNIFIGRRDALNSDSTLNCELPRNDIACRDIIDWTAAFTTASSTATDYILSDIGDDQSVFVAVRAVSESGMSDSNTIVKSLAIPDAGAPVFAGLSSVELVAGGKAKLVWSAPLGQVSNFYIYTTVNGGSAITTIIPAMLPTGCIGNCTEVLQEYTTGVLLSTAAYTFKVVAEDKNARLDTNTVIKNITTGDTQAPGAVSGFSAVALGETSMALSFTSPTDADVNKYEVRYEKCLLTTAYPTSCTGLWGAKTVANIIAPTSYSTSASTGILVLGLEARSVYRFSIKAVDSSNNSSVEIATTKATLDTTPPVFSGVASVMQNSSHPSQIQVSWDSPGGDVASYVIYRRRASLAGLSLQRASYPEDVYTQIVTEPTVVYNYTSLTTSGETWYFTVHAVDDQGNEDINSAQRSYTIPDLTPPDFIATTLSATWTVLQDSIVLNWTAPAGVSQYKVEAQCKNTDGIGAAGAWPALSLWPLIGDWVELATLGASATSYTLARTGTLGTCAGGEYITYRFRVHAKKATSDWDSNSTIKPDVPDASIGAKIPDMTPPSWPSGATLTGLQTSDTPNAQTIKLTFPDATDTYSSPVRNGSGLKNYDVYLVRNTDPRRVLIQQGTTGTTLLGNRIITVSALNMVNACDAPKTDPSAAATTAITDGTCRFAAMQNYTFSVRASDNANNAHTQDQELLQSSPTSISDITPPALTQVALSYASLSADESTSLSFTAGESGSYRILECTANCDGVTVTPTYLSPDLASGTMTAASPITIPFAAGAFSAGSGVKYLAIMLTDSFPNPNSTIYTAYTATTVPTVTINSAVISAISINPASVSDGNNFTVGFTSNQSGTYRILECNNAACGTILSSLASGSMTASTPVSRSIDPTNLSALSGVKYLAIELKDSINNIVTFTNATPPSVATIERNAAPTLNISNFSILKYKNAGVPTFRLSWTLPVGLTASEQILIRKGNATLPINCTSGSAVSTKAYTDTSHEVAVASDTSGNVSYAAFVFNPNAGICTLAVGTTYGVVWNLSHTITNNSEANAASYAVSTTLNNVTVSIAEARANSKITDWTGTNTSTVCVSTATLCGASSTITSRGYFAVNPTALTTASTPVNITYDYSNNTQHPAWAKRHHRFYFSNSAGTNLELSDVYNYVKVPNGMVYVPASGWPQQVSVAGSSPSITESYPTIASMGDWDAVPHDYAIDKYEASIGSGSFTSSTTFPNADTGVLVSANAAPETPLAWYQAKQGCLNRSYDVNYLSSAVIGDLPTGIATNQSGNSSTVINNPRRKYHLSSGIEWTVAAYGTPDLGGDGYCNIDDRAGGGPLSPSAIGTGSTISCASAFGARNMIGNLKEWTDDLLQNGKRGGLNKWFGTVAEGVSASAQLLTTGNSSWNFRSAQRLSSLLDVIINSDAFSNIYQTGSGIEGGSGGLVATTWIAGDAKGNAIYRGGQLNSAVGAGRFYTSWTQSPKEIRYTNEGARCAIIAPQPKPYIARFASESTATTVKLSWITLDTEDSTVVKLASATTKAELDTWVDSTTEPSGTITISLDAVTGKHLATDGNGCVYTPKAAGFESEVNTAINPAAVAPNNYYSGKYCATALGTKYYKLCATNPSIAHVTDEYTEAQRMSCSAVVAVVNAQALPSFVAYANAAKLQNDSDGAYARFYFNVAGGTNPVAKLVYGISADQVKQYNGDASGFSGFDTGTITSGVYYGTLSGVKVIEVPASTFSVDGTTNTGGTADCATAELLGAYKPTTLTVNGVSATHFACVNMSTYPKWSKMFFKVMLANTDSASSGGNITSGWVQSEVRGAGNVPPGMSYITREEWKSIKNVGEDYTSWPVCVGSINYPSLDHIQYFMPGVTNYRHGTTGCVYDYAVDKYENYIASGAVAANNYTFNSVNGTDSDHNTSQSNVLPLAAATAMPAAATTVILKSAKAQTSTSSDWFLIKQGCNNRTSELVTAGFLANTLSPTNNVRLPTGGEWTMAAYNTPDNATGEVITASNGNSLCNVNAATSQNATNTGAAFAGSGGMVKCASTFGTYDQIGGLNEFTDEVTVGGARTASTNWYHMVGTAHATAFPASGSGSITSAPLLSGAVSNYVSTWDYLTGVPLSLAATGTSYFAYPSVSPAGTAGGWSDYSNQGNCWSPSKNWVARRGGDNVVGQQAGRFYADFRASPVAGYSYWNYRVDYFATGRCVVSPP